LVRPQAAAAADAQVDAASRRSGSARLHERLLSCSGQRRGISTASRRASPFPMPHGANGHGRERHGSRGACSASSSLADPRPRTGRGHRARTDAAIGQAKSDVAAIANDEASLARYGRPRKRTFRWSFLDRMPRRCSAFASHRCRR
jgi:hypothetical protein